MKATTGIKKLANGKWQARYFAGFDSAGKRQYPSQTFELQSDAVKWRNQQTGSKANGARVLESTDLTVGQYLEQYLAIKRSQIRANTLVTYTKAINSSIVPELGAIKLSRLRPLHLAAWQSTLIQRIAGSTASTAQAILRGALETAVTLQLISANPLEGLALPKKTKGKFHPLTVEQALAYLKACADRHYGIVLSLALQTGLRPEEYLGLKWANVGLNSDRSQGVLQVRQVVQYCKGGGWRWEDPKTKKGRRSVCFSFELYQQLQEHRRRQLELKLKCGGAWNDEDLVFSSSKGTPISQSTLVKDHRAALTAAGVPRIRVYDLRHAFVTFSLLAGVDPKTVSAEAGHASVAFTLDTYGHVLEEQFETAGTKRAALFAGRQAAAR